MKLNVAVRLALSALACSAFAVHVDAQSAKTFKTRLSPMPIDLTMAANIAGSGSVTAVLNGTKLTVNGTFEGLKSPATTVQIRKSQPGVRGEPTGLELKAANATNGSISGTLDVTPTQVADLQKGWLYVQLQSEKATDGNLWGWVMAQENKG